jgi:O-antigen/teichoic acid export membrane protein
MVYNVVWLGGSFAVAKPLWFAFITAGCMRLLSEEAYGQFTTALAMALLLSALSDLGTGEYSTREIARDRTAASWLFTNLFIGRTALATLAVCGALAIAVALNYTAEHLLAVAAAGLYAIAFRGAEYCRAFFRAYERLKDEALLTIGEKVLVVGSGMAALIAFGTSSAALFGMSAGMIVMLAITVARIHIAYTPLDLAAFDPHVIRATLFRAAPIGAVVVLGLVPLSFSPVVVDAVLGTAAAGHYGAAQRVVEAMLLLTSVVVVVAFPRLSALYHKGDMMGYRRLLLIVLSGLAVASTLLALGVSLLAVPIVTLLAGGDAFADAAQVLAVLAWVQIPMCLVYFTTFALLAADSVRAAAWATGTGAIACALSLILLTPTMGLMGPVVALAITYLVISGANALSLSKTISGRIATTNTN